MTKSEPRAKRRRKPEHTNTSTNKAAAAPSPTPPPQAQAEQRASTPIKTTMRASTWRTSYRAHACVCVCSRVCWCVACLLGFSTQSFRRRRRCCRRCSWQMRSNNDDKTLNGAPYTKPKRSHAWASERANERADERTNTSREQERVWERERAHVLVLVSVSMCVRVYVLCCLCTVATARQKAEHGIPCCEAVTLGVRFACGRVATGAEADGELHFC